MFNIRSTNNESVGTAHKKKKTWCIFYEVNPTEDISPMQQNVTMHFVKMI